MRVFRVNRQRLLNRGLDHGGGILNLRKSEGKGPYTLAPKLPKVLPRREGPSYGDQDLNSDKAEMGLKELH